MKSASEPLVFVVRMWIQTADGTSGPQWRGSVKDIDAGLLFYVAGARDVADFIDGRLAERVTRSPESDC